MNPFIEKLSAYGIDTEMALSRFANDEDLYEKCFYMLLDDPTFQSLGNLLTTGQYDLAFNAAHSLKGVIGNLELGELYRSISAIVELLRAKTYDGLDVHYKTFMKEYEELKTLKQ